MASSKHGVSRKDIVASMTGELIDRAAERIVAGGLAFGSALPSEGELRNAHSSEHTERYYAAVAASRSLRRSADLLGVKLPEQEWIDNKSCELLEQMYGSEFEDARAFAHACANQDGYPAGADGNNPAGFLKYQRRIEMSAIYKKMFADKSIH